MKKKLIIGIGEILWDIFKGEKKLGGAPANFAFHASQLGADGVVVSAIGRDSSGDEIVKALSGKTLRTEFQTLDAPTGSVRISLDAAGTAEYVFTENCAWDNIQWTDRMKEIAKHTDAVCFGTLAQRGSVSRNAIRSFLNAVPKTALRIFDMNLRQNFWSPQIISESLLLASMLKINEDELKTLSAIFGIEDRENSAHMRDKCVKHIFENFPGIETVVLTCGGDGSFVFARDGSFSYVESNPETKIVDTVGAGDSFTATFAVSVLSGEDIFAAHRKASKIAAFVCSRPGAMPELPKDLI